MKYCTMVNLTDQIGKRAIQNFMFIGQSKFSTDKFIVDENNIEEEKELYLVTG